jgi:predicted metalloprotease
MRWRGERRSENVEDRRRIAPMALAGGGIGTILIIVIGLLLGADPRALLQQVQVQQPQEPNAPGGPSLSPEEQEQGEFVRVILASTEDVWTEQFEEMGKTYEKPTLVLFTGQVRSACGMAGAAVGPFYCPGDGKVYIDLSFYDELRDRFQAPGDFAQAYVIAHEIGHHVQNLLGTTAQVDEARSRLSQEEYNQLSVRLELQADFLAGVWAHHAQRARQLLEQGDIEEGLNAAAAIGDDRLQKESQGYAVPDSFTHGSSAQRVRWFRRGLETGDIARGDTFRAREL